MGKKANKINKTPPRFSQQSFWDTNMDKIDYDDSKSWVIARIVSYGSSNDNLSMFQYYGEDVVKKEVVKIRYFDKKTLNYLSIILNIPKENFRAYHNEAKTWF